MAQQKQEALLRTAGKGPLPGRGGKGLLPPALPGRKGGKGEDFGSPAGGLLSSEERSDFQPHFFAFFKKKSGCPLLKCVWRKLGSLATQYDDSSRS